MKNRLTLSFTIASIALFISTHALAQKGDRDKDFNSLKGVWVKQTGNKDTLECMSPGVLKLTLEHGSIPPRDPEGLYFYSFTKDGIVLQWYASSKMEENKPACCYQLDAAKGLLQTGNFYKLPNEQYLVFKKLR